MRITGGELGGRRLEVSPTIRPTQDMVRQAIYSALAARVPGARVLDLFAGSGSLGLEAWSRGAGSVCWVEGDGRTLALLKKNVETLAGAGSDRVVVRSDALAFLGRAGAGRGPWDLILADPPYDKDGRARWLEKTLSALSAEPMLAPDGILVFEQGADEPEVEFPGWSCFWTRSYGGTRVGMWREARDKGT
jgi:16S rRNA (guanine966-N2)-methyltransferase